MLSIHDVFSGVTTSEMIVGNEPGWFWMNPSIAKGPEGYRCILRSSNFASHDGVYTANDPDGFVRTKNYLCELTDDVTPGQLHIKSMQLVSEIPSSVEFPWVQNMEDARLFWDGYDWRMTGTMRQHRADGLPQMANYRLSDNVVVESYIMMPWGDECEKNWMPISGSGLFVYSVDPPKLYNNRDNNLIDIPAKRGGPKFEHTPRGGTQVIGTEGGWLCVTHEVTWIDGPGRYYWHRFVMLDSQFRVKSCTEPFYFVSPGIEFAAGLVAHLDDYVVTFGQRDERAMMCRIPRRAVLELLK